MIGGDYIVHWVMVMSDGLWVIMPSYVTETPGMFLLDTAPLGNSWVIMSYCVLQLRCRREDG